MDESGTPDVPGNTSHYVLVGFCIPVEKWKECDKEIQSIKQRYGLQDEEVHVAWILRKYSEQSKTQGFEMLTRQQRRSHIRAYRTAELLRLQKSGKSTQYKQTKKNYDKTNAYIHLSYDERERLIRDLADAISNWTFARLFAECVDKVYFDPARTRDTIDEQAFEQVVSRFEHYLKVTGGNATLPNAGLLIHDNNETVAKKHTAMMKRFHDDGTRWTNLQCVIETPLFVNSELTGMVQIADLCAYAIRRFIENQEQGLFDLVFRRADRKDGKVVGIRHFTIPSCNCLICTAHR